MLLRFIFALACGLVLIHHANAQPRNFNPQTTINNTWDWMEAQSNSGVYTSTSPMVSGQDCLLVVQPGNDYRKFCSDYVAGLGGLPSAAANTMMGVPSSGQTGLTQMMSLPDCPDVFGQFMYWFQNIGWKCVLGTAPNATKTGVGSLPPSTTSATFKMLGLAQQILPFAAILTPKVTGNVDVTMGGMTLNQSLIGGQVSYVLVLGSGSPPSPGDPIPGGAAIISGTQTLKVDGGFKRLTVNQIGWALGLTLGVQVWVDVAVSAPTGGTAQLASITIRAIEE